MMIRIAGPDGPDGPDGGVSSVVLTPAPVPISIMTARAGDVRAADLRSDKSSLD